MKSFLLKSLLFVILLSIIDFCAGGIFQFRDKMKSGTGAKISYIMNGLNEDVIIMGSSRGFRHYNSQIFEDTLGLSTYNAAINGNGIVLASGLADLAFKDHSPQVIVYELTPTMDLNQSDNIKYLFYLKPYFDKKEIRELFYFVSKTEYIKMHSSLYRLNSYLMRMLNGIISKDNNLIKGFEPNNSVLNYEPSPPERTSFKADSIKKVLLTQFIENAKAHNIDLFFTVSPIYSYPDTALYSSVINFVKNKGVIILDHSRDTAFVGNKRYFSDRTHLNGEGANKISEIISSEISTHLKSTKDGHQ